MVVTSPILILKAPDNDANPFPPTSILPSVTASTDLIFPASIVVLNPASYTALESNFLSGSADPPAKKKLLEVSFVIALPLLLNVAVGAHTPTE